MRAQVGVEAAVCTGILLIMLLIVVVQAQDWNARTQFEQATGAQKAECIRLQSAIYLVQSVNENAQIELQVVNDVNFEKNSINFSDYYCNFSGNWISANLARGNVRIKKVGGVVGAENF